jgi:putative addiction module component (TIGR02574 family)
MTATVAHLVEQALLLPSDSRTELVEAILESAAPSSEFIDEHMSNVLRRMEDVRERRSQLIPAEEAHQRVREALAAVS